MTSKVSTALWDDLLSEGVVSATVADLTARTGASKESVYLAVHRAKAARKLFTPTYGLYVLVPPDYRSWGVVPADWFIDDMMRHLGHRYYVSLLTAAAIHGATHQAAQTFQVMTEGRVLNREIANLKLRFYRASDLDLRPAMPHNGPTGRMSVATPETCALDLAERPGAAGGVNTILEILPELAIDPAVLVAAASHRPRAVVRRCGWMLTHSNPDRDLSGLHELAEPARRNPTPLVPGGQARGEVDRTWGVRVNTLIETVPA